MTTSFGRAIQALASMVLASTSVAAQDRPLSATLLSRLGAAAADFRTGDTIYLVVAYQFPHDLLGAFPARDSARATWMRDTLRYGMFGPFVTEQDFGLPIVLIKPGHCLGTIICYPRPEIRPPVPPWFIRDIDSLAITAYHRSGDRWHSVSRGLEVDAVFFTLAAFDKFAVPYYSALYGPARAAALRDSIAEYVRGARQP